MNQSPDRILAIAITIFFAIGLHEYAHCKVADMAGDPTPGSYGRVTLNLTKHFELMGTIMIIITAWSGFGIGWGKPAPMDPRKMANPRWDFFAAVLAGPLCNLFQAIIYGIALRFLAASSQGTLDPEGFPFLLLYYGVLINLSLCFFNLVPLGPLDGHWLLGLLLPEKPRFYWYRFNAQAGTILLILIVIGSQLSPRYDFLSMVIERPVLMGFRSITGLHLG